MHLIQIKILCGTSIQHVTIKKYFWFVTKKNWLHTLPITIKICSKLLTRGTFLIMI
jgi:hypothetical protein